MWKKTNTMFFSRKVGAIVEYSAAREHKLLATAVPWSMNN